MPTNEELQHRIDVLDAQVSDMAGMLSDLEARVAALGAERGA